MLVVEDDENLRETVQDWLIFENHTVEIAITGPEALEQLSISQYDLIVLDWYLPDIDGIEVLKRYRASGGTAPVLMYSGRDSDEAKQAGLAAGATKFLIKPFRLQELSATIKEALAETKS
ncbi:MAG: two-component system, OmpR family, manganese sensing response regulator [Cyanobacteriota bacterium erpe_2018_sw_21hr_WHONDRS-SW48-000092_B_bin.40]|nr:two-component system, OmpR family, manganese sensing response regulator [Cyanobacteriota bacterium erpe_2018_sw_21hr_WHONDRS-SW48-000092_B_bin.40]